MSLAQISPKQRRQLRWHGFLLMLWVALIGLSFSALLLHVFHVHSMAWRYSLGAGAVYFVGFLWGGKWYARWWLQQARSDADFPKHASVSEVVAYDQERVGSRKKWLENLDWLPDFASAGDDIVSALLTLLGLVVVVLLIAALAAYIPWLATDLLAGYLAEVVLEFVIGGIIMRRILKPKNLDHYLEHMLKKTWLAGVAMMLVFGAFGYLVQRHAPEAHTLLQAFR